MFTHYKSTNFFVIIHFNFFIINQINYLAGQKLQNGNFWSTEWLFWLELSVLWQQFMEWLKLVPHCVDLVIGPGWYWIRGWRIVMEHSGTAGKMPTKQWINLWTIICSTGRMWKCNFMFIFNWNFNFFPASIY